jgi:predicted transcriptional regulator
MKTGELRLISDVFRDDEEWKKARRTQRQQILEEVAASMGGMTDDEIQRALKLDGNTERPRRCELVKAGLLTDSGRARLTRSGRRATVWVTT